MKMTEQLQGMAKAVRSTATSASAATRTLENARSDYGLRQAQLALQVDSAAIIDDGNGGKRVAKNQGERDAVLTILQQTDALCISLKEDVDSARNNYDIRQAALQCARDEQSNIREMLRYMAAALNAGQSIGKVD